MRFPYDYIFFAVLFAIIYLGYFLLKKENRWLKVLGGIIIVGLIVLILSIGLVSWYTRDLSWYSLLTKFGLLSLLVQVNFSSQASNKLTKLYQKRSQLRLEVVLQYPYLLISWIIFQVLIKWKLLWSHIYWTFLMLTVDHHYFKWENNSN